jgi:hypothetical protein
MEFSAWRRMLQRLRPSCFRLNLPSSMAAWFVRRSPLVSWRAWHLPYLYCFFTSFGNELEKLSCCLGQALDFVGARSSSLVERLDSVSCCIQDVVGFGVCWGAAMAPLIGSFGPALQPTRSSALPRPSQLRRQVASYRGCLCTTLFDP